MNIDNYVEICKREGVIMGAMDRDVFKEVAVMAGDIVFRYDLLTRKFMQYTDREEVSKYGAWMFNLEKTTEYAKMVHDNDRDRYSELIKSITEGNRRFIEGEFRLKMQGDREYSWYRITGKTIYNNDRAVEVIGRISNINHYKNAVDLAKIKYTAAGIMGADEFLSMILKKCADADLYTQFVCIQAEIPEYYEMFAAVKEQDSGELLINIMSRLKRCFSYGCIIGRLAFNRFGIFTSDMNQIMDIIPSINAFKNSISDMGALYGIDAHVNAGVSILINSEGAANNLLSNSYDALKEASYQKEVGVVFYSKKVEAAAKDALAEHETGYHNAQIPPTGKSLISYGYNILMERHSCRESVARVLEVATAFCSVERACVYLVTRKGYEKYVSWESDALKEVSDAALLKLNSDKQLIESGLSVDKPYIVDDVRNYPDDSEYGMMINSSGVLSVAQYMFECNNGVKGIVSFENYKQPHTWCDKDFESIKGMGSIAEFYSRYDDL